MRKLTLAMVALWLALVHAPVAGVAFAQEQPLASLVPSDAGLCVELHDLAGRSSWFAQSDLYRRLQTMAPFGQWQADLIPRIAQISRSWSQQLDMEPKNIWSNIFGQEMMFAVWPKGSDDPGPGHGLLLLNAADADLLLRVVQGLGSVPPHEDDTALTRELEHAGTTYWMRVQNREEKRRVVYLAAAGRIGIVTSNERVMRRVLELARRVPRATESLADLPVYQDAAQRWRPGSPMRLFINPLAWDPWMVDSPATDEDAEKTSAIAQVLRDLWQASRSWIASIDPGPPVVIDGYVKLDRDALSTPVRELLECVTGKSEFLERVPEDAVIALGASIDVDRLNRLLVDEPHGSNLHELRDVVRGLLMGMDVFDELSKQLGPDVGSYFLIPGDDAETAAPVEWVVGLRTAAVAARDKRPSDALTQLDERLRSSLRAAADVLNAKQDDVAARVETVVGPDGVPIIGLQAAVDTLDGRIRAYSFYDHFLFAGSSHGIVRQTATLKPERSLAHSPRLQNLMSPWLADPSHVLYVDCASLRSALAKRPESLAAVMAAMRGLDQASLRRIVWQLTSLLHLADSVALSAKFDDEGIAFAVGVLERTSAPDR